MADLDNISAMGAFQLNTNLTFGGCTDIERPFSANGTIYFFFHLHTKPFLSFWFVDHDSNMIILMSAK